MPEIRTYTVYRFEELSAEAQKNAIALLQEQERENSIISEIIQEDFVCQLQEYGYPTDSICFSLGYCQGDGVAFYGQIREWEKILPRLYSAEEVEKYMRLIEELDLVVTITEKATFYQNAYSMHVIADYARDEGVIMLDLAEGLRDRIQQDVREVSRELEKMGYAEIEHSMSEQAMKENIEANDWRFLENGKLA